MKDRHLAYLFVIILIAILTVGIVSAIGQSSSRNGYVSVKGIEIVLYNENATLELTYDLDPPARFLVLLLGKGDLRNRLMKIVNYENATIISMDLERAVFSLEGVVIDYGDGAYWFPEHRFGNSIPVITIVTPQTRFSYYRSDILPRGIGYFRAER